MSCTGTTSDLMVSLREKSDDHQNDQGSFSGNYGYLSQITWQQKKEEGKKTQTGH